LYTAPSKGAGTAVIQAAAGGKAGRATITIASKSAPAVVHHKTRNASIVHHLNKRRHV
jgi:hypothetical protein